MPGGWHTELLHRAEVEKRRVPHFVFGPREIPHGLRWRTANSKPSKAGMQHDQQKDDGALDAGHCDRKVREQTLPEALEWVWSDYRPKPL